MAQKGGHLLGSKCRGMLLFVEDDITSYPMDIGVLGAEAVVPKANLIAQLV